MTAGREPPGHAPRPRPTPPPCLPGLPASLSGHLPHLPASRGTYPASLPPWRPTSPPGAPTLPPGTPCQPLGAPTPPPCLLGHPPCLPVSRGAQPALLCDRHGRAQGPGQQTAASWTCRGPDLPSAACPPRLKVCGDRDPGGQGQAVHRGPTVSIVLTSQSNRVRGGGSLSVSKDGKDGVLHRPPHLVGGPVTRAWAPSTSRDPWTRR